MYNIIYIYIINYYFISLVNAINSNNITGQYLQLRW